MLTRKIIVAMAVILASISLSAAYSGGDGSSSNPFLIETTSDWLLINGSYYYQLNVSDLSFASISYTPIASFSGNLDLMGNTVSDITISGTLDRAMFYQTYGAEIYNGTIYNSSVTGTGYLATLIARAYSSTTVHDINVSMCNITSSGVAYTGNVIAYMEDSTISNVNTSGYMSGTTESNGGIVGLAVDSVIEYCIADTMLLFTDSKNGGIVAYSDGTIVRYCANHGDITGTLYCGGLVARLDEGSSLHDSYNNGDITGTAAIGGCVGFNRESTIDNIYNSGLVTESVSDAGGLIAVESSGTVTTSYYDINTSGQTTSNGGTSKTTSEMMLQSTYSGWDFNTVWQLEGYPILQFEELDYTINPTIIYPVNATEIDSDYPALTDVAFVWSGHSGASSSSYQLSRDSNYNTLVSSGTTTNNYKTLSLDADDYWFRVRYLYDAGSYSDWTEIQFSINTTVTDYGTAIQGVVYESTDGSYNALQNAKVTIYNDTWSDDYITGSNGYYLFENLAISDYYLTASKDGYETSSINIVNVTSAITYTKDIYLEEENAPTYITPHYVTFVVKSVTLKYSDVEVNVYIGDSATVYKSGTTGSDGSVTFKLDEDVEYRLTFYKEGIIDRDTTGTFPGTSYTVWVDVSELIESIFDTSDQEISNIDIDVTTTNINDSAAYITVNYTDSMDETSGLVISILQPIPGQSGNYTTLDTYNAGSVSSVSHSFIVTDYGGESYVVSVTGTHTTHGEIDKLYGVTFPTTQTEYGIGTQLLAWIAIAFVIWIGSTASQADVYPTGIVVCGIAGFFKIIGITGDIISWNAIILAIVICIAGMLYKGEQEAA